MRLFAFPAFCLTVLTGSALERSIFHPVEAGAAALSLEDGVTDDEVLLGQSCALKGPAAGLGSGMQQGLEAYFGRINADGGVDGRRISLRSLNDGYEPKKTTIATKMLIEKVGVFAMIGGVGTPTAKVAVPLCEEAAVPFFAPFTGAEFLRNPFKPEVVNLRGSYFQEMERHAQHLVDELGLSKIACFYQDDAYGQAGLAGIEKALEARGMSLCATGTYERNTVAVAHGVAEVGAASPEAVVMVGAYKPCAAFIKAARGGDGFVGTRFCNISFVGTKNLLAELGPDGEGCIVSQVVPFPWDDTVPLVAEYHETMKELKLEDEIGFVTLEGYMAGKLFCEILDAVEGVPSRAAFLAAVQKVRVFDLGGIEVAFGPEDHQGMDEVFLTVFEGGEVLPLD